MTTCARGIDVLLSHEEIFPATASFNARVAEVDSSASGCIACRSSVAETTGKSKSKTQPNTKMHLRDPMCPTFGADAISRRQSK
jgi:hypothetical protein